MNQNRMCVDFHKKKKKRGGNMLENRGEPEKSYYGCLLVCNYEQPLLHQTLSIDPWLLLRY